MTATCCVQCSGLKNFRNSHSVCTAETARVLDSTASGKLIEPKLMADVGAMTSIGHTIPRSELSNSSVGSAEPINNCDPTRRGIPTMLQENDRSSVSGKACPKNTECFFEQALGGIRVARC